MNYLNPTGLIGGNLTANTCIAQGTKDQEPTVFESTANALNGIASDLREINALLYQFNGRAFGNAPTTINEPTESAAPPSPGSAYAIEYFITDIRKELNRVFGLLHNVRKVA